MECCTVGSMVLTKDGVLFTPTEVQQMPSMTLRTMHANRSLRTKYDYDEAITTGKLRVYSPTPVGRGPATSKQQAAPAKKWTMPSFTLPKISLPSWRWSPAADKRSTVDDGIANWVVYIIKIVMGIIGSVSAVLSIYYLHDFLMRSNTPTVANVLSVTMVLAMLCFCELTIYFWQKRPRLLAAVFAVLWLLPVSFTVMATVDANFYRYMAQDNAKAQAEAVTKTEDRAQVLLQEATKQASDKVARLERDIEAYKQTEKPSLWRIDQMEKGVDKARAEYVTAANAELQAATQATVKSAPENSQAAIADRPSSFVYIAEKLGWDPKLLQLLMSLVPALFNEFMAPIALGVAMFLKPKRKEIV